MAKAPFVINPALVAIAVDYLGINRTARGYIADELCPIVRVDSPEFRYPEFGLEDIFDNIDNQVDRLGRLNEVYSKSTETTGATIDYGLAEPIPFRDEMAAQNQSLPFNHKTRAIRNVVNKNQLAREIRVASLLQTPGNYGAQTEDEVGAPWTVATVNVPDLVENAANSMLLAPNTAFMSKAVRTTLRRHQSIGEALGGTLAKGRTVTDEELAEVLGVDRIVVGNTLKNTAKRGQTVSTGAIWGDHFGLLHVPASENGVTIDDDTHVPAFALTFAWGDEVSGETADPEMGLWGGVRVRSGRSMVEKIVAPFGGYLFQNVLG